MHVLRCCWQTQQGCFFLQELWQSYQQGLQPSMLQRSVEPRLMSWAATASGWRMCLWMASTESCTTYLVSCTSPACHKLAKHPILTASSDLVESIYNRACGLLTLSGCP